MKTYPYNRASIEGRRLFRLLDGQFNRGVLDVSPLSTSFESNEVSAATQSRVNKVTFLFPSNLSGVKRPQIRVDADVELAWGEFSEEITTLDFTHDDQELPLSYVQPLDDGALKLLIDAGLYREERFEVLMNKLMADEVFDAQVDMNVTHLGITEGTSTDRTSVLLVDPVTAIDEEFEPEKTSISNLVRRSALLAIELQKDGIKTEELVRPSEPDQDHEVFLTEAFTDAIAQKEVEETSVTDTSLVTASELLDEEIDVTDKLKGGLSFDYSTEDDRIRDLKDRVGPDVELEPESETDSDIDAESEPKTSSKTEDTANVLDPSIFDKDINDYTFESEDEGPEI
ncbi:hypothetical protein HXA32_20920 [Salipaludibacillus agaradhaerens]|uniref:hypothetical protein n=3 Tax=Salipaludibacillus agaradhaerens TaxID=76935 RepID=UPI0021508327|nr:hypothetical protein [Salipaludibacillus agaradhaerens]MCR6108739.1 hypothetical protein [Salipaludibacillus agaradhaerens]